MDDLKKTVEQSNDDAQLLTAHFSYPASQGETNSDTLCSAGTAIPYPLLLAHIKAGVVVVQQDMICYLNPTVSRLTGYQAHTFLAQPFSRLIYPDDLPRVLEYQQQRGQGETEETSATFRLVQKGDKGIWVEATLSQVNWAQQTVRPVYYRPHQRAKVRGCGVAR